MKQCPQTPPQSNQAARHMIRFRKVQDYIPVSRSTYWRGEREGRYPARYRIGPNSVAWDEQEILDWLAAQRRHGSTQEGR